MHNTIVNLNNIKAEIQSKTIIIYPAKLLQSVKLLVLIKSNLIEYGHNHFGENKVQEAVDKWMILKKFL